MWRLTISRSVLFLLSAEYSAVKSNVQGLARNLSDLTVASSQYDILLYCETFVSDMNHVSEILVHGFTDSFSLSCCARARCEMLVLLRNAGVKGAWCETEPLCVQSLPQP